MMNMIKCCLNPKVLAGVGAAGVAIWLVAPGALAAALPLLLVAICPLSMLLMMGMMMRGNGAQQTEVAAPATPPRSTAAVGTVSSAPLTRDEHIEHLHAELKRLDKEQVALARQVEALESADGPSTSDQALQQAEKVARAADRRQQGSNDLT